MTTRQKQSRKSSAGTSANAKQQAAELKQFINDLDGRALLHTNAEANEMVGTQRLECNTQL